MKYLVKVILSVIFFINILYSNNNITKDIKNILILHSYHETSPWVSNMQRAIEDTLDRKKFNIVTYVENMDTKRFNSKQWYEHLVKTYKLKYKKIKFDVIIASDNNAFNFLKKYRNSIFGNVPVSFCGVNFFKQTDLKGYDNYTGVAENEDFDANMKLIDKLFPNTKTLYVTVDHLASGKLVQNKIKTLIKQNNYKYNIVFSKKQPFEQMLNDIEQLDSNSIVLYGIYFKDSTGKFLAPEYTSKVITQISKVPVLTMFDLFFQNGVLGGNMISSYSQGKLAAELANKILDGVKTSALPVIQQGSNINQFDYQVMKKFGLTKDDLPLNSIVVNKNLNTLTKQEINWILSHKAVTVGGEMDWKPFDFVNQYGDYDGITYDILNLISKRTGLKFDVKTNLTWQQLLDKFKEGKIDILPAIYYSDDRAKYGNFSNPYINIKESFFVRKDSKYTVASDLANVTFVGIKGYNNIVQLKKHFPHIKVIEVDNLIEAINLLLAKKADALLGGQIVIEYLLKQNHITEIKSIPQSLLKTQELRMLIQKNQQILYSIINKTLESISEEEINQIKKRWSDKTVFLTSQEKKWTKAHPSLTIAIDPFFLPFSGYIDENHAHNDLQQGFCGMSVELIKAALKQIGIKPKFIHTKNWSDSLHKVQNAKIELILDIAKTPSRIKKLRFTNSITYAPRAIVTYKNNNTIHSLQDLTGKVVGVVKDGAIAQRIMEIPHIKKVVQYDNLEEALKDLADKKIEAVADSFYVLAYLIQEYNYIDKLYITNKFDVDNKLYIAGSKEKISPIGISVLNKALSGITKAQKSEIQKRWSNITIKEEVDYTLVLKIIGIFLIVLGFIAYWNRKIALAKREALEAKEYINSIMDAQENFVITTNGEKLKSVNKAFLQFYNVKDIQEFIDNYGDCICNTFASEQPKGYLLKYMQGMNWLEYIHKNPTLIHKTIIYQNGMLYIFKISVKEFVFNNKVLNTVVLSDITEMENMTNQIKLMHKHTKESIEYASLIQAALIPNKEFLNSYFSDSSVTWIPKDTVGGDIWLFNDISDDECLLFCIDCTGHGVPGAFVTMIVKAIEREIVSKLKLQKDIDISPAKIMGHFNKTMKILLKQTDKNSKSNVGWDGAIIYYNKKDKILKFAGAETPLFYITKGGEITTIKGNRYSVGYKKCDIDYIYKESVIQVEEGMSFYCTTDGFLDQNGGSKDFPFGKKRFTKLIQEHFQKSMSEQKDIFYQTLLEYESMVQDNERNDDITLITFKIKGD